MRYTYTFVVEAIDIDGNTVDTLEVETFTNKRKAIKYARDHIYVTKTEPIKRGEIEAFLKSFDPALDVLPQYSICATSKDDLYYIEQEEI